MGEGLGMNIREFYYVIKKRGIMILSTTLLCTLVAGLLSIYVIKPTYQAEASLIVGKPQVTDKSQQFTDIMMYQNLVKTYTIIAESRIVAESAKSKLNFDITVDELQGSISISSKEGTQFIYIKAERKDAQQAVNIVNAMTYAFVDESKRVFPTGGDIQIIDSPEFPKGPVKPKKVFNCIIALFLGLISSTALAFMLEQMDKTIKTEEDVEKYLGLPVIGIIPRE